jgi:hypothetical protein
VSSVYEVAPECITAQYTSHRWRRLTKQARDFGWYNEDVASGRTSLGERLRFRSRDEMTNAFNRRFAGINTSPARPLFAQIIAVDGDRSTQAGLRAGW